MKKITIAFAALLFTVCVYSQTTLSLCAYVSNDGYCAFNNNKFITTPDSATGRVFMKVNSEVSLGTKLTYKIFALNSKGEETLSESFSQDIKPDWLFAWMPYPFPTNAKYNIKVFNDVDKLLCSKAFELVAGK